MQNETIGGNNAKNQLVFWTKNKELLSGTKNKELLSGIDPIN